MSNNNYCHSRSSSDSENIPIKEILPVFLSDFIRDFEFRDILPYLPNTKIFTDEECLKIKNQETQEKQIILMFFILKERESVIEKFLNVLKYEYSWLSDKVSNSYKLPMNKEFSLHYQAVYELRSNFPKHSDCNVHRLDYYCSIREELYKLRPKNYLVIYGELGFGKKWLALDACVDYSVMKKMRFKIFWLDMHNCDSEERDLEKLQRLKILLGENYFSKKTGDYEGISNKILELQQDLRLILRQDEFKHCLLVLSDVQNRKTIETFDLRCKILITTRNKKIYDCISSESRKIINISEGLSQTECKDLFEKVLRKSKANFPENSNDLFHQSKGHPFLLNVIAQNLKEHPKKNQWMRWIENLDNFQIDDDKILNIIKISLKVLNEDELELFYTLSIFYHSVKIPIKVLALLWKKKESETINIIRKFDKFSLVNIAYFKDESMACLIHFLYSSYLKSIVNVDRTKLHRDLIENYDIKKALAKRTESDLIELPNDDYFHYYIGFHLKAAKMLKFFPKLYLDFGFLGQKLRATGLPNTIGDLKYYRKEITENDPYREKLLDNLLEFIPNIEAMIHRSNDTNLLQYALMYHGPVHEKARKLASKFSDKVWFLDAGHFHQGRQILPIPGKLTYLKLIEPEICLIALDDKNNFDMLFTDTSLGYSAQPTKLQGHKCKVTEVELFNANNVISLDREGKLMVWSIADERRRSVTRKQSSRLIANHIDFTTAHYQTKLPIQTFEKTIDRQPMNISHFHLDNYTSSDIYLHLILNNGDIFLYKWLRTNQEFKPEIYTPVLHTKVLNARFMLKLFDKYYIILNNTGSLKIFKITDGSSTCFSFKWPPNTNSPLRVHQIRKLNRTIVIFVFAMQVIKISFPVNNMQFIQGELDILYTIQDRKSAITCSCLTDDNRYLIIGSKKGLIIFDILEKSEVLRNSVSESIVCVDVCSLNDDIFKYVIVSGSEKEKVVNIFCLKLSSVESPQESTITWANSVGSLGKELNSLNPHFEPNTWLIGNDLFDVIFNENSHSLVAVDSKNRIHQMTSNSSDWSIIVPTDINGKGITSITTTINAMYYFGCENGKIFNSNEEELKQIENDEIQTPINFLKLINENLLIASTYNESTETKCLIYNNEIIYDQLNIGVIYAYTIFDKYLILLDKNCSFLIYNIEKKTKELVRDISTIKQFEEHLGGSDLKENLFVIGTSRSQIYVYKFLHSQSQGIQLTPLTAKESTAEITCIAISPNTMYIAVGLKSGLIEIYTMQDDELKLIQNLESHKSRIYDMKFSPWNDLNLPIILASSSEQLCFWDITYILNNPLDHLNGNQQRRRSTRFGSTSSANASTHLESRRNSLSITDNGQQLAVTNPWLNKTGPSDKPELLSCIKYAGRKAEKFYNNDAFTKFVTIDDEGEYYFFTLQEFTDSSHLNGNIINTNGILNGNKPITNGTEPTINGNHRYIDLTDDEIYI